MSLGVSISYCTFDEITRKEGLSLDSYINNAAPDKNIFFECWPWVKSLQENISVYMNNARVV